MIDSSISYLMYAHGLYNVVIILLFLYQGWLGLKIRKNRMNEKPPPVETVKGHRRFGPVFSILGFTGFLSGLAVAYISHVPLFTFPFHFIAGLIISIVILLNYLFSRMIKSFDSFWRNVHFVTGAALVCLYFIQAFLGAAILL